MLNDIAVGVRLLGAQMVVVGHSAGRRDHAGGARPGAEGRPHCRQRGPWPGAAASSWSARRSSQPGPRHTRPARRRGASTCRSLRPRLAIDGEDDIVASRQRAREIARQLGFGAVDQSRIATAVSELGAQRRALRHGRARCDHDPRACPPATVERGRHRDRGLRRGARHRGRRAGAPRRLHLGGGMGMGPPGTRRLMDEMSIDSVVGRGRRSQSANGAAEVARAAARRSHAP